MCCNCNDKHFHNRIFRTHVPLFCEGEASTEMRWAEELLVTRVGRVREGLSPSGPGEGRDGKAEEVGTTA